ncbi:MAG: class I SAM-dependent methyltransferase [Planctomycetota bacterium]
MSRFVEVRDGSAHLPDGLWEAMGQPRCVVAHRHRRTPQYALWAYDTSYPRSNLRPWLRSFFGWTLPKAPVRVGGERVEVPELSVPNGRYGVIHRRTHFLLSPVDESSQESDYWRQQENYQEHRPAADQKDDHQAMTQRLVESLKAIDARSYLEVGCGAGRNLVGLQREVRGAIVGGIDIHAAAIENAQAALPGVTLEVGDLHDLSRWESRSWDVVFTSGTLMHVEHDRVESAVREFHRIARRAVVHYEYHGPSFPFDFRYYPRDYGELYASLALPDTQIGYEVLDRSGYRKRLAGPFDHCVLVAQRSG